MKQITIRGVPREVEEIVKEEAKRKGISLNKAFISVLESASGIKTKNRKEKAIYHDLDHLAGLWSDEESEDFMKNLENQRKIDEELWKEIE
jgi:hypothetical protein